MDTYALELIRTFNPWAITAVSGLGAIIWFGVKSKFATKAEVAALQASHEQLARQVEELPSHEDISRVLIALEGIKGDIKEIKTSIVGLQRTNHLLLENELKDAQ